MLEEWSTLWQFGNAEHSYQVRINNIIQIAAIIYCVLVTVIDVLNAFSHVSAVFWGENLHVLVTFKILSQGNLVSMFCLFLAFQALCLFMP